MLLDKNMELAEIAKLVKRAGLRTLFRRDPRSVRQMPPDERVQEVTETGTSLSPQFPLI